MTKPNSKNFCGGSFPDWLEVNLTDKCNGKCKWCIERKGWHPVEIADWETIGKQAISHGALNIILLGGEPTLYPHIGELIKMLYQSGKRIWITTNGSILSPKYIESKLIYLTGINISLHHYDLSKNKEITGLKINLDMLVKSIQCLKKYGISVRLNCNCIKRYIDNLKKISHYILFAKVIGANKIRFAELKGDNDNFVDLAKILNYKYALNDNPFLEGCNSDAVIWGMPVNFRQMCGLQTSRRVRPDNPVGIMKKVLYYDGKFYNGWQIKEEDKMDRKIFLKLLKEIESGEKTAQEVFAEIDLNENIERVIRKISAEGYCQY